MRIRFGDLKLDERAIKHIEDVVKTNWISEGPKVKQLEETWGKLFDYKNSIAVSNGADAGIAACKTLYDLGARRGDEIITPALAFASVGNSILDAGFIPVFVDIERETLNLNSEKIEEKITDKTKAIKVVHTMGKPCDMDKIMAIASKYDLSVIEDCCEAHGAKYREAFVGSFGDMATFSFFTAHIVACGDGGIISTNNPKLAEILTSIKQHGREPNNLYFNHVRPGSNFRMNDLVASVGIPAVEDFWTVFNKRKDNFYKLENSTKDLEEFVYFTKEESHEVVSPHAFSLTLRDNKKFDYKGFYNFLEDKNIQCKRNFGSMPTQHKAFAHLGHKLGDFPEAEYVGNAGLHFGIHQFLTEEDLDYASDVLHKYFKKS